MHERAPLGRARPDVAPAAPEAQPAQPVPEALPAPAAPVSPAAVLSMQGSAGNAAVARYVAGQRSVARAPGPPGPPVVAPPDAAAIQAMTLNELDTHARAHADWAQSLDPADHDPLVSVLEYGRLDKNGAKPVLGTLGTFKVSDLRAPVNDGVRRQKLTDYALHVGPASPSVKIQTSVADVAAAEKTGEAVGQLDAGVGAAVIGRIFVERSDSPLLAQLIDKGWVADFINYAKTAHPNLEGDDGVEIRSYLLMRGEGAEPVADYVGKMGHSQVRNYHRFLPDTLKGLKDADGIPAGTKPVTLILHTAEDHNGAFHRKSELRAAVLRADHHPVMIEGAQSLAEITHLIPTIAALGVGGKIAEAVVAGHGDARSMGMAIKPDGTEEQIDLNNPANGTDDLLKTLVANMSTDPNARIVLAACLTGSEEVPNAVQGATTADQQANIKAQLAANPSLRTKISGMLPGGSQAKVVGSNVSIPFPTLVDPANPNGPLTIDSPENPEATSDRLTFIKVANEPEGALRAVLAEWAKDKDVTMAAVEERLKKNQGMNLDPHMTETLFKIVHDSHAADPEYIRQLSIFARAFDFLPFPGEACRASLFDGMPAGHDNTIFEAIRATTDWADGGNWFMRLVTLQAWAARDPSKAALFTPELGKVPKLSDALEYLNWTWIEPHLDALVPAAAPVGVGPGSGEARLALLAAGQGKGVAVGAHVRTFLAGLLGADPQFPAALDVDNLLKGTGADEFTIIENVRPTPAGGGGGGGGGGAFKPDPNVDTDGKPGNDRFIEPLTRHGIVVPKGLNVRTGPGMGFKVVDLTREGDRLYVIGKSGNWYAIEWDGHTRFVHSRFVDLENVAEGAV